MSQSHIIDSWIAELKLSGRRTRGAERPVVQQAAAGLDAPPLAAAAGWRPRREARERRPRYSVISFPC